MRASISTRRSIGPGIMRGSCIVGNKAERFTADGSQLTLGVLGLLLTPEEPEVAPEAPPTSRRSSTAAARSPASSMPASRG